MSVGKPPFAVDVGEEISELIAKLHETGQRLEQLTAGEVDTVADRDGRPFLLHRAQEQLRDIEAAKQAESDLRFRQIAENIREVFWLTDPAKDQVLYISPAYEEIWGRSCESVYASPRDWLDAIHPEDREQVLRAAHTQASGKYAEEYRIVRPDGTIRWIRDRAFPVFSGHGEVYRIAGLAEDITEIKGAAEELRESARRFSDLLGNIEMLSLMLDATAGITYCNDYLLRLTGWRREEVIGRDWFELFIPPDISHLREHFADLLANRTEAWHHENEILTRSGERRLIRWNNSVLRSGAGEVIGTASVGEDITEQKRAEVKIKRLNRVYAVLSGINTLIVRVRDREELFSEACRIAVETGGFAIAWIGMVDRQAGVLIPTAWTGPGTAHADKLRLTIGEAVPDQFRLASEALREKRAIVSNDIAQDPRVVLKAEMIALGLGSVVVLPLIVDGAALGTLSLVAAESGFFDEDEMKLLTELAGDIAFAIDHLGKQERLASLGEELRQFAAAMDATADAIYLVERSSLRFIHVNEAACRMQKRTREELLALGPAGVLGIPLAELERTCDALIASGAPAKPVEMPRSRNDGTQAWVELRTHALRSGERWMIVALVRDITGQKQAELKIKRLNRVYAVLSEINALIVRVKSRDELFEGACRIVVEAGQFRTSWIGMVDRDAMKIDPVASAGSKPEHIAFIRDHFSLDEGSPMGNTLTARAVRAKQALFSNDTQNDPRILYKKEHFEGRTESVAVLPLVVAGEAVAALTLYAEEAGFFDAAEMELLTRLANDLSFAIDHIDKLDRLDYLAYYDSLTGLANRSLFLERVAQYMRSATAAGHKLALYLLDLERFKNINDSLGRPAGDALLKQVAEWLTRLVQDASLVARVGTDHFALVLPEVKPDGNVARLLEKGLEAFLNHPFRLDESVFRLAFKGGVAIFPDDGADADTLFKNAEAALKKAKATGHRYLLYTQKMSETVAGRLTLESQLRQALEKEEFVLHYQPKVSLASGKLTSAEALIRWNDPRTGLVPPGRFIPVLEETGLIYEVGRWALRKAIEDYLRWRGAGLPAVRIAVNVSPLQLRHRGFIADIGQAIGISGDAAAGLELELTESLVMEDIKHSITSLQAIRAMGVTIAIDDFGTGFSSLNYLSKLPVDTLKIDRSFVVDMTASPEGLALVSTIINLAHSLRLKVVAEGVETEEQARLLRLLSCDEMQGYLFSKPLSREDFEARFLAPPPALAPPDGSSLVAP
jgi:diguanylate cyclase (GGDEF)-like protein/PAS domain S-box-containing protein